VKSAAAYFFLTIFFVSNLTAIEAQNSFVRGEELFMQNRPQEALGYLQAAATEDPANVQTFLYLGIAYLQLNRVDDAIETYTTILPRGGLESARIAFNLGNAHFVRGDVQTARRYFSRAIDINPAFASAYINRANTFIRTGDLSDALSDYQTYLSLVPTSPQREQITRMIRFIQEEFAAEEQRRFMEAEAARAEAERRRLLLQEVSDSIQSAVEGTRGLSVGVEGVQGFDSEFELE